MVTRRIAPSPGSAISPRVAISSVADALAQYNANLGWQASQSSASLALEAVRFLLVNRAQRLDDQGSTLNFESLASEKTALEKFLGATIPRAFSRRRRVNADFGSRESIG